MAMEMVEEIEIKNPKKKKLAALKKVEMVETELRGKVPAKQVQEESIEQANELAKSAVTPYQMAMQQKKEDAAEKAKYKSERSKTDAIINTFSPMKSMKKK